MTPEFKSHIIDTFVFTAPLNNPTKHQCYCTYHIVYQYIDTYMYTYLYRQAYGNTYIPVQKYTLIWHFIEEQHIIN